MEVEGHYNQEHDEEQIIWRKNSNLWSFNV